MMGSDAKPPVPERIVRCSICGKQYNVNDPLAALNHLAGGKHDKIRVKPSPGTDGTFHTKEKK